MLEIGDKDKSRSWNNAIYCDAMLPRTSTTALLNINFFFASLTLEEHP